MAGFIDRLILLSSVAVALASCSAAEPDAAVSGTAGEAVVNVTVSDGSDTRVTGGDAGAGVGKNAGDVQVLVFGTDGYLLGYGRNASGTDAVQVTVPATETECWAVVNSSDDLSLVATRSELLGRTSYLSGNGAQKLQMIGSASKTLVKGANSVVIPVERFAARVQINKIVTDFKLASHRAMVFTVDRIYLINVNGSCPYTLTPQAASSADLWYNRMTRTSGACDALLSDAVGSQVNASSPYSVSHHFYCYPNPVTVDVNGWSWSHRYTRLVVEATLGGKKYYYPVNIPQPQPNTLYLVEQMTVTGAGSTDPDRPVEKGTLEATVKVVDWYPGFSQSVEY